MSGTNHLWQHIDRCSSYQSKNKQSLLRFTNSGSADTASTWTFSQQLLRDLLTKMIMAHEQPFTSIEYPVFKTFIHSLQPKVKLYTHNTLKSNVMTMFYSMKAKLIGELANIEQVSLTTDLWTLSNQSPFMVVTAHFILPDWSLNKQIISFKELPAPHTGLAIAEQLINTIVEWKIIDKVGTITVDNTSSNDVAVNWVCSVLAKQSKAPPEMSGQYFHVRCAAHIINLVVKDGLKIVSSAVNKICDSV
jgi:hypothetical protein